MDKRPAGLEKPMFRHLDVQQTEHEGQQGLSLSDPLGIGEGSIFVPAGLIPVLGLFDGQRTLAEIEARIRGSDDTPIPADFLTGLVAQFDELLLLNTPRFEQALARSLREFTEQAVRPASHAGSAGYPSTSDACKQALSTMVPLAKSTSPSPRGLIAPHIDLARGREGYARAYGRLVGSEPAELYVIFGTGHQGPNTALTGLEMNWQTPLGILPTDRAYVRSVHDILGAPSDLDLFLHKTEHSIEFQVLFLQHCLAGRPAEIACFMTGSMPGQAGERADIIAALNDVAIASGKRICYLAGADLAHIGPMFGDEQPVDKNRLEHLADEEKAHLAHIQSGDPTAFVESVERNGNPNRVCGTTPIFLVAALAGGQGELRHYGQATQQDGSQTVSFCSMVFE